MCPSTWGDHACDLDAGHPGDHVCDPCNSGRCLAVIAVTGACELHCATSWPQRFLAPSRISRLRKVLFGAR